MLNSDLADIRANVSAAETSCMGTLFADACAMALGSIDIAAAVDFSQVILRTGYSYKRIGNFFGYFFL